LGQEWIVIKSEGKYFIHQSIEKKLVLATMATTSFAARTALTVQQRKKFNLTPAVSVPEALREFNRNKLCQGMYHGRMWVVLKERPLLVRGPFGLIRHVDDCPLLSREAEAKVAMEENNKRYPKEEGLREEKYNDEYFHVFKKYPPPMVVLEACEWRQAPLDSSS
jgi:hypothetical protein